MCFRLVRASDSVLISWGAAGRQFDDVGFRQHEKPMPERVSRTPCGTSTVMNTTYDNDPPAGRMLIKRNIGRDERQYPISNGGPHSPSENAFGIPGDKMRCLCGKRATVTRVRGSLEEIAARGHLAESARNRPPRPCRSEPRLWTTRSRQALPDFWTLCPAKTGRQTGATQQSIRDNEENPLPSPAF